jgi:hypothetical protein
MNTEAKRFSFRFHDRFGRPKVLEGGSEFRGESEEDVVEKVLAYLKEEGKEGWEISSITPLPVPLLI